MIISNPTVKVDQITNSFLEQHKVRLFIQREDLLHPFISGNKWRKLLLNIQAFQKGKYSQIITFGGAFSNHILAVAAAGKEYNIPTLGIIRGESSSINNSTLQKAKELGMQFNFISREEYQKRHDSEFVEKIKNQNPNSFIVPEGGANIEGVKGCIDIPQVFNEFNTIVVPCGTGTTLSGIIAGINKTQKALGIPVLKNGEFLEVEIKKWLAILQCENQNWELNCNYHLGGYAKNNMELNQFIQNFYSEFKIPLDPIYTGKMMFAIFDLIKKGCFENQIILAVHTGGIQGVAAYEKRYKISLF